MRTTILVAALIAAGCTYYEASLPEPGGENGTGVDGGASASGEFPCEIVDALSSYCWSCHTTPPRGGAPMSLARRADLLSESPAFPGSTFGERALSRMMDQARPMPPGGVPGPSASEIEAFASWVDSGMPEGSCSAGPASDGGPVGPQPTTCTSGESWPLVWDDGSPDMNPGLPCRACHLEEEDDEAYFFMGTVYPMLHEEDRCYSDVPGGTEVHIIDRNGVTALRLPVRQRGNFFSNSLNASVALPFTAKVVTSNGATIGMSTPQMTGDCNGCHTEQGANGAPGRILIPTL